MSDRDDEPLLSTTYVPYEIHECGLGITFHWGSKPPTRGDARRMSRLLCREADLLLRRLGD